MITLTTEQAQQIEEALVEYRDTQMIKAPRKALSIIRAARAQENEVNHEELVSTTESDKLNEALWCQGCNPDNCAGCKVPRTEPVRQEQAEQEPVAFLTVGEFGGVSVSITSNAPVDVGRYLLYAAPVRTKDPCNPLQDLTDDEILPDGYGVVTSYDGLLEFARAVIDADRRKNK